MASRRLRAAVASGLAMGLVGAAGSAAAVTPAAKPTSSTVLAMPDPYALNLLIRTTLIALNQANRSGNYSVLRDLASPEFQRIQSDASLAEIFAPLRRRNLDMSPVFFFDPKLVRQPAIEPSGRLRLSGFIPTRPEQINFDLMFEPVGREWRLFGVSVGTSRAKDTIAAAAPPTTAKPLPQPVAKAAQRATTTTTNARKPPSVSNSGWAASSSKAAP